jgi:hypothetical protein
MRREAVLEAPAKITDNRILSVVVEVNLIGNDGREAMFRVE